MTNYQPERDLLKAAQETKSNSPIVLAKWILNKRNVERTAESIRIFLKRNPTIKDQIDKALNDLSPTEVQAVNDALFENGNFKETSSVQQWVKDMAMRRRKGKPLHPNYVKVQVTVLKQVCTEFTKHPDRLTFSDAQDMFLSWESRGKDSYVIRRVLKDFLKSKNDDGWQKIGVGKPRGFGQYKNLFVEKETLERMLQSIQGQSFEAYVIDCLMFHNGLRINAALGTDGLARIEDFNTVGNWRTITVLEKFRETKTFKLSPKDAELIAQVIGDRKEGKIFSLTDTEMSLFNNQAIDEFCPEIKQKYDHIHPNHFWRHMAAQHLLRITDRNSKAVAALMQCTEQSLNESYGAATSEDIEKWENEYVGKL